MSDQEKGAIMRQMQELPPNLQAQAEAFARGLAAGVRCAAATGDARPEENEKEKEAPANG